MQSSENDGLCGCGCGEKAPLAPRTYGPIRKGMPLRFIKGHQRRKSPVEYIVDEETGCWVWQRARMSIGYGAIRVQGKLFPAHRVVYERERGEIPEGMELHHTCENPPCVNPDHLQPMIHAENIQKSRRSRVTPEIVRAIRALAGTAPHRVIADQFGVSDTTVWNIINGKTWKNVSH